MPLAQIKLRFMMLVTKDFRISFGPRVEELINELERRADRDAGRVSPQKGHKLTSHLQVWKSAITGCEQRLRKVLKAAMTQER
jgi:DNA replication initiation complex subunit (GINS family)